MANYYFDANIFIYLFENELTYSKPLEILFKMIKEENAYIVSSQIVIAEVLRKPMRDNNHLLLNAYKSFFNAETIKLQPLSSSIIYGAAEIGAEHNIKLIDSLHLATAREEKSLAFITNDTRLKRFTALPVLILSEL